jgi:glycine betaine/choline ABC-type transport system substrate-binding protein
MINSNYLSRIAACAVVLSALGLAACKSDSDGSDEVVAQTVTVIGLNTDESKLLTELYAEALEQSGLRVARRAAVADLAAGYSAVQGGAADLFVSYTGELLEFVAAQEPEAAASTSTTEAPTTTEAATSTESPSTTEAATTDPATTSPASSTTASSSATTAAGATTTSGAATDEASTSTTLFDASSTTTTISIVGQAAATSINLQTNLIGEILPEGLQIGAASNAEKKSVIACNNAVSTTGSLTTLTDLARSASGLRLAATSEWATGDPFGAAGFEAAYDATFGEVVEVEQGQVGAAITPVAPATDESSTTVAAETTVAEASTTSTIPPAVETDADCGAFASSLDPTIPTDAVVMDDDQDWITSNGVIPLLTVSAYTPTVQQVVDQVSQTLGTTDLREMNRQVTQTGTAANVVAAAYLSQAGIGS